MKPVRNTTLAVAVAALLGGCVPMHMDKVPVQQKVTAPPPGASLVYFVRPEVFGDTSPAVVLDDEHYVGTMYESTHVAYVTKPGRHLFVVATEAVDFMEAELLPDRTYYASLRRRMGWVTERFSFVAHNDEESIREAQRLVASTPQMLPNAEGRAWVEKKRSNIERMKARWKPVWESNRSRIVLEAGSGR